MCELCRKVDERSSTAEPHIDLTCESSLERPDGELQNWRCGFPVLAGIGETALCASGHGQPLGEAVRINIYTPVKSNRKSFARESRVAREREP